MEDAICWPCWSKSEFEEESVAGMDFLVRCDKVLIIAPNGVATVDVGEYENRLK